MHPVSVRTALVIVLWGGEGYGLQLVERIRARCRGKLSFAQGTVYPALQELERIGIVRSRVSESLPERGGRPRIYYSLTPLGERLAREQTTILKRLVQVDE